MRSGLVYLRSEYPDAATLCCNLDCASRAGYDHPRLRFCLTSRFVGAGFASARRRDRHAQAEVVAVVRAKPPLPAIKGLFGTPTVINNVFTIASVPSISARGAEAYVVLGQTARSGPVFQLAGNIRGGIVETAFARAKALIEDFMAAPDRVDRCARRRSRTAGAHGAEKLDGDGLRGPD